LGADSEVVVGVGTAVDIYVDDGAGGTFNAGRLSLGTVTTSGTTDGTLTVPVGQGLVGADYLDDNAGVVLNYKVASGIVTGQDVVQVTVLPTTLSALNLSTLSVTTQMNANGAIGNLGVALATLNQNRATLGAQQSRMESIGRTLAVRVENNEGARSALLDADASVEITNLSNDQAMLQVGISMLSQSNKLPEMLLQLLRNN